ncbi:MAG: helix-turn-helix transcriptional regulator, partial [Rhizomicrobium sp.]
MKVQNNLSFVRKQRGLTVSQTAALIGVTRQTVYAIEAGSYIPNTLVALKLAAAFCVAVEDLFFLNSLDDEISTCDTAQILPGATVAEVGQPVHLVKVGKRLIATDLGMSRDFRHPPDGVVVGMEHTKKSTVKVQTFAQTDRTRKRLLVSGDDPAFQVLGHHLQLSGIELITI